MTARFTALAEQVVDDLLACSPIRAQQAGDHRYDHLLPDLCDDAIRRDVNMLRTRSRELAAFATVPLDPEDAVDRDLLAADVDAELFELTTVDERGWNPLVHNPGDLLFALLAREAGPPEERLESVAARLSALPDALATAQRVLGECPRVHVETAIDQIQGTTGLVRDEVPVLLSRAPGLRARVAPAREAALAALARHSEFLTDLLDRAHRNPRIGRRLWEARLGHALDSDLTPAQIVERAQGDLAQVSARLVETAAEMTGSGDVRAALDQLSRDHPDNATIRPKVQRALLETTDFVTRHDLLTVLDDPIEIMAMPEYARGVAVAYCDAPGPLETRVLPTFYAISPTPEDWSRDRVASFYREYNDHMLSNLTVHEAMPGHCLQLAHARRFHGSTRVRALCQSGSFIEGWAVYAEEVMTRQGFGGLPVLLQQLKMQLRMIVNAILDQSVHCDDFSEADAMAMMTGQGFQEEAEAAGKWRRALLTSAQLSTYYVGYTEVSAIGRARPASVSPREWHDAMLAHGSPPPRHLRRLLNV